MTTTRSYTARCEWDETGWWVVTVPGVTGAVTQSRRLDQVPGDVAEIVRLVTGGQPDNYRLVLDTRLPDTPS